MTALKVPKNTEQRCTYPASQNGQMVWVVFDLLAHGVWQLQFLHNHLHHLSQQVDRCSPLRRHDEATIHRLADGTSRRLRSLQHQSSMLAVSWTGCQDKRQLFGKCARISKSLFLNVTCRACNLSPDNPWSADRMQQMLTMCF